MKGQNTLRPREKHEEGKLQVHEIFYTIQGEGPLSGQPSVFIRLTGCNLACFFCDTKWDDEKDRYYSVDDLVILTDLVADGRTKQVVLTGGEPLRQECGDLVTALYEKGFNVQIETAGTYWQDFISQLPVLVVCSPKIAHVHPKIQTWCNNWKYVIDHEHVDPTDGLPSMRTQEKGAFLIMKDSAIPMRPPKREGVTVWLSPCDMGNDERNYINQMKVRDLALRYGYRAQIQLHKLWELR